MSGRAVAYNPNLGSWLSSERWRERIISFNASWFVLNMGTGVVVQVLHNLPYQSYWLHNLAYCFWILDMAIFLFFTALSVTRAIMFPKLTKAIYLDFAQTSYLGAIPITVDTILEGLVIFYPDRPAAIWAAFGLYWVAIAMSLCVGILVVVAVCAFQEPHPLDSVTGVWLLSFIPFIVTGGVGGSLVPLLPTTTTAVACLIISFSSWSVGVLMAHLILAIYLYRLVACSFPAREAIISCFIPMGPTGMGAYGIQLISRATSSILRRTNFTFGPAATGYESGTLDANAIHIIAEGVHWFGAIFGLFLVAEATFWLVFAVSACLIRIPRHFNVGFWAFVFPCGVYANALCLLGTNFRNEGFKGYAAAMCTATVLLWCMCAVLTVYKGVWQAQLFFAPGLEGWHERMAMRQLDGGRLGHDAITKEKTRAATDGDGMTDGEQIMPPSMDRIRSEEDSARTSEADTTVGTGDGVDRLPRDSQSPLAVTRVSNPDGTYKLAGRRRRFTSAV